MIIIELDNLRVMQQTGKLLQASELSISAERAEQIDTGATVTEEEKKYA